MTLIRLSRTALGLREEALASAQQALRYRRELRQRNRDAFLPDLSLLGGTLARVSLRAKLHAEAVRAFA